MNNSVKMVVVLTLIAGVASLILASVYGMTKEPIAEAYRQEFLKGLVVVLPEFDNQPDAESFSIDGRDIYPALKDGKPVGVALRATSAKGYGGEIAILVGVDMEGKISGIQILKHAETPGLGNKIEFPEWRDAFKGLSDPEKIKVKKDGGIIDQFSGATITPRATCEAVVDGLSFVTSSVLDKDVQALASKNKADESAQQQ